MFLMPPSDPRASTSNPLQQQPPQPQPLYRITVDLDLNPFLPVSYLTKVVKLGPHPAGANGHGHAPGVAPVQPEGHLVGEFAFALNGKRAVISLGDTSTRLSQALYSVNSHPRHFNWILGNRFHWDCREQREDGSPICIVRPSPFSPSPSPPPSLPFTHPLPTLLTPPPIYTQCYIPPRTTPHSPRAAASPTDPGSTHLATFIPPPPDRSPPVPDATLLVSPYGVRWLDEIVVSALVVERMLNR
ncbi:hypothetical protein CVT26_013957 [Gymnopilus dilepis]|uniref:Uncharacterized protein n=1 Tax=Gymnopilus dilepis TaxID=231916 RepID=A0A409WDS0_9AGAR|nr:hypothetical protein CVT26_013957 [Gymnopilus dilepis]